MMRLCKAKPKNIMQVWLGSGQKPHWPQGAAVTIGNFDGVHQGHRHILQCLRAQADARGLAAVAVVFEPQPQEFFARKAQRPLPYRLSPLRDKLALLADTGCVDAVWVLRFNSALADMNAADFIRHVLLADLNTRYLLVGDDFRFGQRRAGDRTHDFDVYAAYPTVFAPRPHGAGGAGRDRCAGACAHRSRAIAPAGVERADGLGHGRFA